MMQPTRRVLITALSATISLVSIAGPDAPRLNTLLIGDKKVTYLSNRPLEATNASVTRGIIVIHGGLRLLDEYFTPILNSMRSASEPGQDWSQKTIVLAPHFQKRSRAAVDEHWWDGTWREGSASDGISSYLVLDTLVARMRNGTFPNLKWIIITGHSAGGQFVQRYAAFTDADLKPGRNTAFLKFLPVNPSSYVYLNEYRSRGGTNDWIIPGEDCTSGERYNQWKYGLEGLSDYAAERGAAWARTHLPRRQVELIAGEEDVLNDVGFDTDCAAMWQGPTRFARAQIFKAFMDRYYPTNRTSLIAVPGVGHDGPAVYASPQGKNALFFPD